MKALKFALENERYDLAAHLLILSTLEEIEKRKNGKKGSAKGKSKRP